jgi:hypothetical protein
MSTFFLSEIVRKIIAAPILSGKMEKYSRWFGHVAHSIIPCSPCLCGDYTVFIIYIKLFYNA